MNKFVEVDEYSTIYDALLRAKVLINSYCGGKGICGKCVVRILRGYVSKPTDRELNILRDKVYEGYRLACQAKVLGDIEVEVPEISLEAIIHGFEPATELKPVIKKLVVAIANKLDSIEQYILKQTRAKLVSLQVLKKLSSIDLGRTSEISLVMYMDEVIDIGKEKVYGVIMDIGTSKIIIQLIDLSNGVTIATKYIPNLR